MCPPILQLFEIKLHISNNYVLPPAAPAARSDGDS